MTRILMGVAALVAGLSGCAGPAKEVSFDPRTGVGIVSIPANNDTWPNYNRRAAIARIQERVGPGYEIIEEREVVTGKQTLNNQQVNNEETWNTSNPFLPANKQTITNTTTTRDVTEWHIAYRKKPTALNAPLPGSGGVQQTQYMGGGAGVGGAGVNPAGGVVPSAAPGTGFAPAGGFPGGPMK